MCSSDLLSYQWWFNGNSISGANGSAYTVVSTDATKTGGYAAVLTNAFGSSTSHVATLSLLTVPAGSYPDAVLNLNPLVYYRFSDLSNSITTGTSNVFNLGSLGSANNGLVEGSAWYGAGPQPPAWPNFETTNEALVLDGATVDVAIPALNINTNSGGPNMTMVAWINAAGVQTNYAGVIFYRPIGYTEASGLQVTPDSITGENELVYHWNNLYYGFEGHLHVPTNGTWTFVALVIQPTSATFYLNDGTGMQTATNVAAHAAVRFFTTTYVGWDDNDSSTPGDTGTRRFNGLIDEPMIFGRTLSPDEISQLYYAGVEVELQITESNGKVILTWPNGILQQASQVTGPYNDMLGVTSPFTNTPSGAQFYRVRTPIP